MQTKNPTFDGNGARPEAPYVRCIPGYGVRHRSTTNGDVERVFAPLAQLFDEPEPPPSDRGGPGEADDRACQVPPCTAEASSQGDSTLIALPPLRPRRVRTLPPPPLHATPRLSPPVPKLPGAPPPDADGALLEDGSFGGRLLGSRSLGILALAGAVPVAAGYLIARLTLGGAAPTDAEATSCLRSGLAAAALAASAAADRPCSCSAAGCTSAPPAAPTPTVAAAPRPPSSAAVPSARDAAPRRAKAPPGAPAGACRVAAPARRAGANKAQSRIFGTED